MTKADNVFVSFVKKNINVLLFISITILGIVIRVFCLDYFSGDLNFFLIPWYDEFKQRGFHGLANQVGDYNIPYQFILYVLTLLPLKSVHSIKWFSIIFDITLAFAVGIIVSNDGEKKWLFSNIFSDKYILGYTCVLFAPTIFLDSAAWGQCDSVYVFFIFAALYACYRNKHIACFIFLGMAFGFKFQTIFVIPFFVILYFLKKGFSLLHFFIIPIIMIAMSIPGIIAGRGLFDVFIVYGNQTGTYHDISMNYNSFWNIVVSQWFGGDGNNSEFRGVAVIFTVTVLGLIAWWAIKNEFDIYKKYNLIILMHITVFTCVIFLPTMHERYDYAYVVSAIILALLNKKFIVPCIGVIILSCMAYGQFLFSMSYPSFWMALLNISLYGFYLYRFVEACAKKIE